MTHPARYPGIRHLAQTSSRQITRGHAEYLAGADECIDGHLSRDLGSDDPRRLRPGLILGRSVSSGKLRPMIITAIDQPLTIGGTFSVDDRTADELNRLKRVGDQSFRLLGVSTPGGDVVQEEVSIQAINSSGTVTLASATTNAYAPGFLIVPADGAHIPITFIPNGTGIRAGDTNQSDGDVPFTHFPIRGVIDSSQLIPWPEDNSLRQWIVMHLADRGKGGFIFTHLLQPMTAS